MQLIDVLPFTFLNNFSCAVHATLYSSQTSRGSPVATQDENYLTKTKTLSTSFSPKIVGILQSGNFHDIFQNFLLARIRYGKSNTADGKNALYHLISFIELICIEYKDSKNSIF